VPGPTDGRWLVAGGEHVAGVDDEALAADLDAMLEPPFTERTGDIEQFPAWLEHRQRLYNFGSNLRRVRIITMGPEGVIEDGQVVVENGRIVAVGEPTAVAATDRTLLVDARDRTVIPWLIDDHQQALYLFATHPQRNPYRQFSPPAALRRFATSYKLAIGPAGPAPTASSIRRETTRCVRISCPWRMLRGRGGASTCPR